MKVFSFAFSGGRLTRPSGWWGQPVRLSSAATEHNISTRTGLIHCGYSSIRRMIANSISMIRWLPYKFYLYTSSTKWQIWTDHEVMMQQSIFFSLLTLITAPELYQCCIAGYMQVSHVDLFIFSVSLYKPTSTSPLMCIIQWCVAS